MVACTTALNRKLQLVENAISEPFMRLISVHFHVDKSSQESLQYKVSHIVMKTIAVISEVQYFTDKGECTMLYKVNKNVYIKSQQFYI